MFAPFRTVALLGTITTGLLIAGACGTETGNPEGTVELQYNARTTDPSVALLTSTGSTLTVDAVWLRLDPVELAPCDDTPVELDALGLTDHSGADSAVQTFEVPDETYCGLTTSVSVAGAMGSEPAVTDGASIAITGTLSDDRRFEIVVDTPQAFASSLDDEPLPSDGAWLITFDVGTWIDAAAMEALAGDPVVVSATENPGELAAVVGRLAGGVTVHLDENANGVVDPGEREL